MMIRYRTKSWSVAILTLTMLVTATPAMSAQSQTDTADIAGGLLEFDLEEGLVTNQKGEVVAAVSEARTTGQSVQSIQLASGQDALITALAAPRSKSSR